jgi:type VI secretion system secreted protein Hcp
MLTNKATPKMIEACANGTPIKTGTLVCRKAGGNAAVDYLKVTLNDVIISYHTTEFQPDPNSKNEHTIDTFKLNYSKIGVEYKEQKADGSAGASVEGGFNLATLKAGK